MCFSWDWLIHLLIVAVAIIATIKILEVIVPYAFRQINRSPPGGAAAPLTEGWSVIVQVLRILFWAAVVIFVLIIVGSLLVCLWSSVGGFSVLPRH